MATIDTLPALTRQDWMAARIGIADAAACNCREPAVPASELSRFSRVILWLFRDRAPIPLANPRLEMLRRFFCATRAGHKPSVAVVSELQRLGVQPAHLASIANLLN
jgi:hypothetical protein